MMPLMLAQVGEENIIKKIGGSPEVKQHLENLGFVVGGTVKVVNALGGNQRQGVARCHQRRDGEENHDMTALRRSTYSVVPNRYKPSDKRLISDAEQF